MPRYVADHFKQRHQLAYNAAMFQFSFRLSFPIYNFSAMWEQNVLRLFHAKLRKNPREEELLCFIPLRISVNMCANYEYDA